MLPLEGKVAVITGGTSGIGACTAELFVANGAKVVIAGRRQDRGEKLAGKLGDAASFIRTDVSIEADVKAMIDHAVDRFGHVDCLMNNAGMSSQYAAIADVDLEQFDAVIAVHLRAVLAGMKYAARVMAVHGTGSIINVASVNGFRAGLGGHCYSAAKAASIHLTRCAAMELGEKGIRVNSLSPGMIAIGAFAKFMGVQPDVALPEAGFGKNVVIDADRCSGSRIHLDHPNAGRSVVQDHSSDHRFKRLHLTRASVRRASGFVLTGYAEVKALLSNC